MRALALEFALHAFHCFQCRRVCEPALEYVVLSNGYTRAIVTVTREPSKLEVQQIETFVFLVSSS